MDPIGDWCESRKAGVNDQRVSYKRAVSDWNGREGDAKVGIDNTKLYLCVVVVPLSILVPKCRSHPAHARLAEPWAPL
jgi:hypothetical protein